MQPRGTSNAMGRRMPRAGKSVIADIAPAHASARSEATAGAVLVVEDDPVLCEVLSRILYRDGYDVRRAPSAAQALELIEERPPELVILDACLREGTSLELAGKIHRANARLPVIVLTNSGFKNEDFPKWSCGRLLNKSLALSDLRWAVAATLNEARSLRPDARPPATEIESLPNLAARHPLNELAPRTAEGPFMRLFGSKSSKIIGVLVLGAVLAIGFVATNGLAKPPAAAGEEKPAPSKKTASTTLCWCIHPARLCRTTSG